MNRLRKFLPSRRWLFVPPVIAGIAVVILMVRLRQELPRVDLDESPLELPVIRVEARPVRPRVEAYGTARPRRTWQAVAEVGGRIAEVHLQLDSGRAVDAGDVLLRIDDVDFQLRLEQRQADLRAAEASLRELRLSQTADETSLQIEQELLEVTRKELQRVQQLYRTNAVSSTELESVEGRLLQQTQAVQRLKNSVTLYPARIQSAEASISLATARVKEARRDVDRCTIRSPFAGVLAGVDLEIDQVVMPGQTLFELYDRRYLEVEARLSLAQLDRLWPSQFAEERYREVPLTDEAILKELAAVVTTRSGDVTHRWRGRPTRITESLDERTRTFGIVIEVENSLAAASDQAGKTGDPPDTVNEVPESRLPTPKLPLRPGAFCEIRLLGKLIPQGILVPQTALDGDAVYVVDDQNRLQLRAVEIGVRMGDQRLINHGLRSGELVAVKPPVPAIRGMLVRPRLPHELNSDAAGTAAASRSGEPPR
jgi:multidrug efflux pump subunit AcrA (membrane-fusion protein)